MKQAVCLLVATLFFAATVWSQNRQPFSPDFLALVEAERAFARTSVEIGVRDSFIQFFADDGINFTPHPTKTREAFERRPATKSPLALNWEPVFADIAEDGDLGYTTGPYTLTDTRPNPQPTEHGFYFSIWKKQADGSWKVVLDCGIRTPPTPKADHQLSAAAPGRINKAKLPNLDLTPTRQELLALDKAFFQLAATTGTASAFRRFIRDDARLHRNNLLPLLGARAIGEFLRQHRFTISGAPLYADVAQSANLGYTYGSYERQRAGAAKPEKGYYVHVWKRSRQGKWQIALSTTTVIPTN